MLLGAVPASVDERTVLDNLPGTASGVEAAGVRYEWRPYAFSWRWGVEGDFGHQGWHGLKAEMYDDFIRLGATERAFNGMVRKAEASGMKDYYLYTCVDAPRDGLYDAEWGGIRPVGFYVGGERREPAAQVALKKGINEIVLHYDSFGTARFALRDGKAEIAPETLAEAPLRMKFRGDRALLPFDSRKTADTRARFTFTAAPGLEALEFTVHEKSRATGVPLSQLHLKKNLLLCCITRGNEIKIPRGGDEIQVGDNVIVVTLEHGLHDLRDIVED